MAVSVFSESSPTWQKPCALYLKFIIVLFTMCIKSCVTLPGYGSLNPTYFCYTSHKHTWTALPHRFYSPSRFPYFANSQLKYAVLYADFRDLSCMHSLPHHFVIAFDVLSMTRHSPYVFETLGMPTDPPNLCVHMHILMTILMTMAVPVKNAVFSGWLKKWYKVANHSCVI